MATSNIVGDLPKKQVAQIVSANAFSTVAQADIEALAHPINANPDVSGKAKDWGFLVELTAGGYDFYIAQGEDPDSPWWKISGAAAVTPA